MPTLDNNASVALLPSTSVYENSNRGIGSELDNDG